MPRALRIALGLLALLGGARALIYLAFASYRLPTPLEAYPLEAQMAHLGWRVQAGLPLYPSWEDYPYVINVFGPFYFLVVGLVGRAVGADLDGLVRIGRGLSFGSGLLTALVLGVYAGRRHGRGAGLVAGMLSLGAAPQLGFGTMARPDSLAGLLGVAGFLLIGPGSTRRAVFGGALLVLAILTKQTTGVFLLAAAAGLVAYGQRRRAALVLLGVVLVLAGIVAAVTAGAEPNFAACFLGAARTPADGATWLLTQVVIALLAPDLIVLTLIGWALWRAGPTRDPGLAWLAPLLLAASVATSAKSGADLNYFLDLRAVAALAAGSLWTAARDPAGRRPRMLLTLAVAGAVALVPGLLYGGYRIRNARGEALAWATPAGRENLRTYRELFGMAEDPGARLLTDCGPIALHQKERAPFVDPWLFREMVDTGRIRPDRLRRELGTGWYDLVISTADWNRPEYAANPFGLPMVLVQAARRRYQPAGTRAGLFVYVPRGDARRPEAAARPGGSDPRSGPRKRRPRRRRAPTKPRRIPLGSRRLVFPRKLGRGPG